MTTERLRSTLAALALVSAGFIAGPAAAVEMQGLEGLEDIFGRYAPAGNCKLQPRILVDITGLTFEVAGKSEHVKNPEYAASYGGHDYDGPARWIFPFRVNDGYPILMTFNADVKGGLSIDPQDEGWKDGPKLSPRNAALVQGSPYSLCK